MLRRRALAVALAPCLAAFVFASGASAAHAADLQVTTTDEHHLTTIADGVYAIRHKRAAEIAALAGNTTVVVGERDVLVVDAASSPSIARGDLALVRKWTDKPIRYLVNTHWHGDHTWGNQAYFEDIPGITVIAHPATSKQMQGYLAGFLPKNRVLPATVRALIASGKDENGRPWTPEQIAEFDAKMPHYEARAAEFANVEIRLPNLTFERELELDLGKRVVRLLHLGRGNTAGDVVVHLPAEKIVVAGDLLVFPRPYTIGGFPREWAATLGEIARLAPDVIVPGHGAVQSGAAGLAYLERVRDLLATFAHAVQEETYRVGNGSELRAEVEAAVRARADIAALRERFAAGDPETGPWFDRAVTSLVASAYREAWGN